MPRPTVEVGHLPIVIDVTVLGCRRLAFRVAAAGAILRIARFLTERLLGVELRIEVQQLEPPPDPPEN